MCAQLVGEGATPGLASTATSGHTKPAPVTAEDAMAKGQGNRQNMLAKTAGFSSESFSIYVTITGVKNVVLLLMKT